MFFVAGDDAIAELDLAFWHAKNEPSHHLSLSLEDGWMVKGSFWFVSRFSMGVA